jgi:glycosyltransferase involved in cell wall biosynthesis
MKILLAHNYYQSSAPSGEDSVFAMEKELLTKAGNVVITYERHNDEIDASIGTRVSTAATATWSKQSFRDVETLIKKHRPDIAHFHNTFPLISPSAYRTCHVNNVPVVQTLHNYRLICPGALLMRDNQPCEQCVGGSLLPAIRYSCYRNSRIATAVVASMLTINKARDAYTTDVNRYIALTEFARDRFIRGGLPEDRIVVRPNFLTSPPSFGDGSGNYALYVGRLTPEKGVATLVQAWRDTDLPLNIVGDGYLRSDLEQQSRTANAKIEFLGLRSRAEVWALMQRAAFLIIPSECYEGFPITVLEAFATGTPLIVSAIGALDEVVAAPTNGLKFQAGNVESLRQAIALLHASPEKMTAMRIANRQLFEDRYTQQHAVSSLHDIYADAIKHQRSRQPFDIATKSTQQVELQ